jgi:hypothetical protein
MFLAFADAVRPDERDTFDFVREAHRASRELIRTLSCQVKSQVTFSDGQPSQSSSGAFWYSPALGLRAKVRDAGRQKEYLWKDSVRTEVTYVELNGQRSASGFRDASRSPHLLGCDPWARGLLVLNVPNTGELVPLEQLTQFGVLKKAERQTLGGAEVVVLRFLFPRKKDNQVSSLEAHLDPAANYLVRSVLFSSPDGTTRGAANVTEFTENPRGIFFPKRITGWLESGGRRYASATTEISAVRINEPLADSLFALQYPQGVIVTDAIRGVEYHVNAEGQRISNETRLASGPSSVPVTGPGLTQNMGGETQDEPTRWTWGLVVAALALATAGAGFAVKKWRSTRRA